MIGIALRNGIAASSVCEVLSSRPAIANDWPSRNSTSVSARRVVSAGIRKPGDRHAVVEVQRADFGPNLQANDVAGNRRREVQPDAELLELHRDLAGRARDKRHRELAARQEAGFLAVVGDQVRLGQALEQALLLQRADDHADAFALREEEQVQEIAQTSWCRRRSRAPKTAPSWHAPPSRCGSRNRTRQAPSAPSGSPRQSAPAASPAGSRCRPATGAC